MAKTKRRGRLEPSTSYYILQITDWDWSYHFGVNAVRHDERHYSDYRHLLVRGKVLRPSKLRQKAEPVEVTFLPDVPQAALEERGGERPLSVGYLQIHEKVLTGGISMATDALGLVMQMLIAGRFKYLVLYGEPMRYRQGVSAAIILKPSSIPRITQTNEMAPSRRARLCRTGLSRAEPEEVSSLRASIPRARHPDLCL